MTDIAYEGWEPVIGLEIHVQLSTASKLFSPAPNRFGDEPNLNISAVCTGQPGALPVLNKEAVRKAVLFGLAVGARIAPLSKFDRKSYFYPDSPRNFQITQYDQPLLLGGVVAADVGEGTKHFCIHRAHLEDDAGMLKHFPAFGGVDYNRAGIPLLEIVSEPCMHSPKEAAAYAMAVRAILQYIGASDCNMEEGSLRIDVNVSVRPKGKEGLNDKIEIKNMSSFANMELALEAEIRRQIRAYALRPHDKDPIDKGTYRFDPGKKETVRMRTKEEAADYRYFPDPDLPPLHLSGAFIEEVRRSLPELPHQRYERYVNRLGLTPYNASLLINDKPLSDYFEEGLKHCAHPTHLCNWITVEFVGRLKETGKRLPEMGIPARHIAKLVSLIESGAITGKIAKNVADEMLLAPGLDPEEIVRDNSAYQPLSDSKEIGAVVDAVLIENPDSIAALQSGKTRAFDFLVGQVMKRTQGKASPSVVNRLLKERLKRD